MLTIALMQTLIQRELSKRSNAKDDSSRLVRWVGAFQNSEFFQPSSHVMIKVAMFGL